MATYAEKLRDSLIKIKHEEFRFEDENGKVFIQEACEKYPICFSWFNSVVAGIALHIIKCIHGENVGIDAAQDVLFKNSLKMESILADVRMSNFLEWLLDQEVQEPDWESDDEDDDPVMWYDPKPILDLFNTYINETQEAKNE